MKLEQKIIPYLPYGLRFEGKRKDWALFESGIKILCPVDLDGRWEIIKPILRPLSDLTKEIEVNGEKFVPQDKMKHLDLEWLINSDNLIMKTNYEDVLKLLEWHFDIFELIKDKLAIDINTL